MLISELTLIFQQLTTGELEALQRTLTSAEQSVHKGFMQRIPTRARLNRHLVRHLLKTYFLVTLVGFLVLLP